MENALTVIADDQESLDFLAAMVGRQFSDAVVRDATPVGGRGEIRAVLAADYSDVRDVWRFAQIIQVDQVGYRLGRPAEAAAIVETEAHANAPHRSLREVFVVHGRDTEIVDSMFAFLRSINLEPLDWNDLRNSTGSGAPFNIEVVEKGFERANAVVVLLTPDDIVQIRDELAAAPDEDLVPQYQPRPNVLIEGGMSFAFHPTRTIMVEFGRVKVPSDWHGRNRHRFTDSAESRRGLANALASAGCDVQMNEGWETAGTFPPRPTAVPTASASQHIATPVTTGEQADETADVSLVLQAVLSFQPEDGGIEIPDAKSVHERTGLPLARFNYAVGEIEAQGLAETVHAMGTKPYPISGIYPSHASHRWLKQFPSPPLPASPASQQSARPQPTNNPRQPDFGIEANNLVDAQGRYFDLRFLGGEIEAREVLAVVRTSGQTERLALTPDWIEKGQRLKSPPHARTGAFPLEARPVLEMYYENLQGEQFYLRADLIVDGGKVRVASRTVYDTRPDWSWLDQHPHVPLFAATT